MCCRIGEYISLELFCFAFLSVSSPLPDYVKATVDTVMKIHFNEKEGDVLAFLTGMVHAACCVCVCVCVCVVFGLVCFGLPCLVNCLFISNDNEAILSVCRIRQDDG